MNPRMRALVVAVLDRAYRDLTNGPEGNGHDVSASDYRDARQFISSPWFSTLCEALDINPDEARESFLRAS